MATDTDDYTETRKGCLFCVNRIKDAPFVLAQFINGVNGIGMSV